jgi:hypothetical protein
MILMLHSLDEMKMLNSENLYYTQPVLALIVNGGLTL